MEGIDLGIIAPFVGMVAPILVYLAARQRTKLDAGRGESADEAGLWERMSLMIDRYGAQAEKLAVRVKDSEEAATSLKQEVAVLRGSLSRWKSFAMALSRQMQAAGLSPVNPVDFGLGEDD